MPPPPATERCACGSEQAPVGCCGVPAGPYATENAVESLLARARWAAQELERLPLTSADTEELWRDVVRLPVRNLGLLVPLPARLGPAIAEVLEAIEAGDARRIDQALLPVLTGVDTPVVRAGLVRRVLGLRDEGRIDGILAAAAVIELASPSRVLLNGSLVVSIAASAPAADRLAG
ncbi:MAG: hypothetical protein ACRDJO_11745 [Actinomycetota bacterium]